MVEPMTLMDLIGMLVGALFMHPMIALFLLVPYIAFVTLIFGGSLFDFSIGVLVSLFTDDFDGFGEDRNEEKTKRLAEKSFRLSKIRNKYKGLYSNDTYDYTFFYETD